MENKLYNIFKEKKDGFYLMHTTTNYDEAISDAKYYSKDNGKSLVDEIDNIDKTVTRTLLYSNGLEVGED